MGRLSRERGVQGRKREEELGRKGAGRERGREREKGARGRKNGNTNFRLHPRA